MGTNWDETANVAVKLGGEVLTRKRGKLRDYLARMRKDGLEIAPSIVALTEHAELTDGEQAHGSPTHTAHVNELAISDIRMLVGITAAAHVIGGWTYPEFTADALRDGYPIVGALVGRLMHGSAMGETDTATAERLVETLKPDERMFLVCSAAAMLGALGFTQAAIASLSDPLNDVANAAPQDVTPDMVDAAMAEVGSLLRDVFKPETD